MQHILQFFIFFLLIVLAPQSYSDEVPITIKSSEIADYDFVPLINDRNIRVNVYDSSKGCPDINKRKKGFVGREKLTKAKPQRSVDVASDGEVFLTITNFWRNPAGTKRTCFSALAFTPDQSGYTLDVGLVTHHACPDAVLSGADGSPATYRKLAVKKPFLGLMGGGKVSDGYCD